MGKSILFIGALLLAQTAITRAQNPIIDSLENLIQSDTQDTLKCLAYSDLCWEYRLIDQGKAIEKGRAGVQLSRKINYRFGEAKNLNDLSIIYIDKSSLDTAILLLNQAKDIRLELGDESGVAAIHNKLGIIYEHQVKLEKALTEHLSALRIYEKQNIKPNIGFCLNNIGNVHFKMMNYDKALEIHQKALTLRMSIDDAYGIAGSHSNLANTYQFMGDTTQAIFHCNEAIKVYRVTNYDNDLAVTLSNLASLYVSQGLIDKAEPLANEAYDIRTRLNDVRGIASTSTILGEIYTDQGQFKKASTYFYNALSISKTAGLFNNEKGVYEKLAKLYSKTGDADSVFYYYSLFYQKEKELYQENLDNQVNDLQTVYETEKKDRENEKLAKENAQETAKRKTAELELSRRNFWILGISGFVAVAGLLVLVLFQRFKRKSQEEKSRAILEERDKGIKAVINTQEKERSRISKDLHDGIGQQLSGIKLAWSAISSDIGQYSSEKVQKLIELTKILDESAIEVRNLAHQMMPKLLSEFGLSSALKEMVEKTFQFSEIDYEFSDLNIGETRFNEEIELGLYRVAQELVNNAIKHARAKKIEIQIYKNNDQIHLIVIDDGIGFELNNASGHGTLNIETRLNAINGGVHYEMDGGCVAHVKVQL